MKVKSKFISVADLKITLVDQSAVHTYRRNFTSSTNRTVIKAVNIKIKLKTQMKQDKISSACMIKLGYLTQLEVNNLNCSRAWAPLILRGSTA